jgi:hypothetical protein
MGGRGASAIATSVAALAFALTTSPALAVDLARETTVTGNGAAHMDVNVPNEIDLREAEAETVQAGDLLAVALVSHELNAERERPYLVWLHANRPTRDEVPLLAGWVELPPGRYRLFVVAAGGPGTLRATLPGLAGSAQFVPPVPGSYEAGPLPVRTQPSPSELIVGRSAVLEADGLVFARLLLDEPQEAVKTLQACYYPGGEPAEFGDRVYGPACPGSVPTVPSVANRTFALHTLIGPAAAGPYGLGGNARVSQGVPGLSTLAAWIPFPLDTPGQEGDTPQPGPGPGQDASTPRGGDGSPPPGGPGSGSPDGSGSPALGAGVASLARPRIGVRRGRARVPLQCAGAVACRGTVEIAGASRSVPFQLAAGKNAAVSVRLKKAVARRLARKRRMRATLELVSELGNEIQKERRAVVLVARR